jgi:hypothetical protein
VLIDRWIRTLAEVSDGCVEVDSSSQVVFDRLLVSSPHYELCVLNPSPRLQSVRLPADPINLAPLHLPNPPIIHLVPPSPKRSIPQLRPPPTRIPKIPHRHLIKINTHGSSSRTPPTRGLQTHDSLDGTLPSWVLTNSLPYPINSTHPYTPPHPLLVLPNPPPSHLPTTNYP